MAIVVDLLFAPPLTLLEPERAGRESVHRRHILGQIAAFRLMVRDRENDRVPQFFAARLRPAAATGGGERERRNHQPSETHRVELRSRSRLPQHRSGMRLLCAEIVLTMSACDALRSEPS